MLDQTRQDLARAPGSIQRRTGRQWVTAAALGCALATVGAAQSLGADDEDRDDGDRPAAGFCSATAALMFSACASEVKDDYFKAQAICINVSDPAERKTCTAEASNARREGSQLCRRQLAARRGACKSLGEERYDLEFEPSAFEDDIALFAGSNRYFPLTVGHRWEYRGGDELVSVEVLNRSKLIEGVRCVVVNDRVFRNGELIEDTDDWFAQAKNGDAYYCGEEVKDYESFEGDRPRRPELVSIDGSFKWGRDGDKGGIFLSADPNPGDVSREEFSLGNAEDVSEVLSTTYAFGAVRDLDRHVPAQLARLFCFADCLVTKNFSLLEPGAFARKYYAPGIGLILEVNLNTGETVQLVDCSFDSRCHGLPQP